MEHLEHEPTEDNKPLSNLYLQSMKTLNQFDTTTSVQDRVVELIMQNGKSGTTYAELHHLEGFIAKEGELGADLVLLDNPNLILWRYVTPGGHEAMQALKGDERFSLAMCMPFLYFTEGLMPNLPIAKSFPAKTDYKTQRWVPALWTFDEQGINQ
jgi:hypothetical protein